MEDEPGRDQGGPAGRCRVQPLSPQPTPDSPSPGRPGSPAVGVAEADGPPTPSRAPRYPAVTAKARAGRRSRLTTPSRQPPRPTPATLTARHLQGRASRPARIRNGRHPLSAPRPTRPPDPEHKQGRVKAHRRPAGHHAHPQPTPARPHLHLGPAVHRPDLPLGLGAEQCGGRAGDRSRTGQRQSCRAPGALPGHRPRQPGQRPRGAH